MKVLIDPCRFVTGILLICCLMALFSCSKTPQLAKLPSGGVVLAFGDSITFGTGAATAESYPSVLEKRIGRRVVNAGVPGEVTAEGRVRLASVLDEYNPALMILCLGGNDFLRHQDETKTAENLRAMISLAQSRGVGVVLISVPKLGLGLEVPKFYGELAKELAIPLEGKILKQILSKGRLKSDAIHPNASGYSILAESVAQLLRNSGALQDS
jgi:lysophospholipase L1-like esterase